MSDKRKLTTNAGCPPVADSRNVLAAGPRGPQLLQDARFLKRLAHLDREAFPERRMHAKISGACRTFTVTHDFPKYIRAKVFSRIGKKVYRYIFLISAISTINLIN
ncbi:MAG: catalase [Gallionella sp.]